MTSLRHPESNAAKLPNALRDWVRREIRARIADGSLHPGQRLLEREIADRMNVSRVPVREALRLLEAEGYLVAAPTGGVVVRQLDADEINEMFDVRGALEALAARLATRYADEAATTALHEVVRANRRAIDDNDTQAIGRTNHEFHALLRRTAANRFVTERVEPLIGRLSWAYQTSPDPEHVWRGHLALLHAIVAGDEEMAAQAAHLDNEHNREIALNLIRTRHPRSPFG
ncbi:DNA-binding transcriptional regulator, GntR family [Saccharopolyspora kobensis]|uniref:Transcriptional regulator, GntR family n=2 Tax=Saccharopolyspora kobensis TaxID=146035 RepID=A0A1H5V348_9PSEU|nr:DNA-binding transcriptional regulator, GntR family [Saccharopolyspora kobensis]SFC66066.1 transcriptional regulator, GntR family [Saccharopolyspora kobensis]